MKTIRQILTCIMAGSVCYACHVEPNEKQPTVETAKKEYLKRESIFIDEVIRPARMAISNNQLYISCFSCDTMVYTYSLPDLNLLNSHGIKGSGPEDFMFPVFTQAFDNMVSMWGYTDLRKVKLCQVDTSGVFTTMAEFMLPENKAYNQLFTLGDSVAFYNDFPPNLTLKKLDLKQGKELKEHTFEMDQSKGNSFFAQNKGDLCVSSKGLAYLYYYKDRIDFFNLDFQLVQTHAPQKVKQQIDTQDWQNSTIYYIASYAGDQYLYAIKLADRLNANAKDCTLEIFGWDGTLINSYSLNPVIDLFVVDESNQMLYGVNREWPDYIYKFKL